MPLGSARAAPDIRAWHYAIPSRRLNPCNVVPALPARREHSTDVTRATRERRRGGCRVQMRPWQCLNFLPEPHGQGALRGVLPQGAATAVAAAVAPAAPSPPASARAG